MAPGSRGEGPPPQHEPILPRELACRGVRVEAVYDSVGDQPILQRVAGVPRHPPCDHHSTQNPK